MNVRVRVAVTMVNVLVLVQQHRFVRVGGSGRSTSLLLPPARLGVCGLAAGQGLPGFTPSVVEQTRVGQGREQRGLRAGRGIGSTCKKQPL